ncbi:MAG: hypothetical protein WCD31_00475, partial [Gillisia sp.]
GSSFFLLQNWADWRIAKNDISHNNFGRIREFFGLKDYNSVRFAENVPWNANNQSNYDSNPIVVILLV